MTETRILVKVGPRASVTVAVDVNDRCFRISSGRETELKNGKIAEQARSKARNLVPLEGPWDARSLMNLGRLPS